MKKFFIICMLLLSSLSIFAQTINTKEYIINDRIYKLYFFNSEEELRNNFNSIIKKSPYLIDTEFFVNHPYFLANTATDKNTIDYSVIYDNLKENLIYDLQKYDESKIPDILKEKTPLNEMSKNKDKYKYCLSVFIFSLTDSEKQQCNLRYNKYVQVILMRNVNNTLFVSTRSQQLN